MIAGTGGVYTSTNLPLVWAAHQNQIIQVRGYRTKRSQILCVSQHLIGIREMFGLTMTELALALGVSRPTAYSWINGIEPKEPGAKALIDRLSKHVDALRNFGIAKLDTLARQPLTNGQSLVDILKARKDPANEIFSRKFSVASVLGRSQIKRDFGPTSKVRRVRIDEISVPVAFESGDKP